MIVEEYTVPLTDTEAEAITIVRGLTPGVSYSITHDRTDTFAERKALRKAVKMLDMKASIMKTSDIVTKIKIKTPASIAPEVMIK